MSASYDVAAIGNAIVDVIAPAEEAFLTAIAVAKQQKAKSFELRAAMSLARLWRDR